MGTNRFWLGALVISLYVIAKNPTKHHEIIISCAMAMIIVFLLPFIFDINAPLACVLSLVIGLASTYQLASVAKIVSCVENDAVASAGSVSNSTVMSFGYFFYVVIANMMNFCWKGEVVDRKPLYGTDVMIKSMLVIPICLLIGMGLFWSLKVRAYYKKG